MKKALCMILAAALLFGLTGCESLKKEKAEPVAEAETKTAAVTGEKPEEAIYETGLMKVVLLEILEDSLSYHARIKADSTSTEELNLEFTAFAFNGLTIDSSYSQSIPAGGNAYMDICFDKGMLADSGITGLPAFMLTTVAVYDEGYNWLEGKTVTVGMGGEEKTPSFDEKEELYNENGIRITGLGVLTDAYGSKSAAVLVENQGKEPIILNGGAAAAPCEVLSLSVYNTVLPGTKAVARFSLFTEDYQTYVDPAELPFITVMFSMQTSVQGDMFITEPVRMELGEEKRYTLSEDGKSVELRQNCWSSDFSAWTLLNTEEEVLVAGEITVKKDAPEEGYEEASVILTSGKPGVATCRLLCHEEGVSLEETENSYSSVYCDRSYTFKVNEDGTIEPGELFLEIPDFATGVTWYYILRGDGTVLSKDTAAG